MAALRRPCTARKPRAFGASAIRIAGHGTLCRACRALAGAGVSASGGAAPGGSGPRQCAPARESGGERPRPAGQER